MLKSDTMRAGCCKAGCRLNQFTKIAVAVNYLKVPSIRFSENLFNLHQDTTPGHASKSTQTFCGRMSCFDRRADIPPYIARTSLDACF